MRKIAFAACVILAAVVVSCSQKDDFQESGNGFSYNLAVHNEDAKSITDGMIVMYHSDYMINDTVLFSSRQSSAGTPHSLMYNQAMDADSVPMLMAIKMCHEGDSGIFKFNAKDLFENSFKIPLPDSISPESNILAHLKVVNIFTREDHQAYMEGLENEAFEKQLVQIDEMLDAEGVEYQTTESGLRYVIVEEGQGEHPNAGDEVTVHYTGMLVNGTVFDSSVDRGEPFQFPLGVGRVIPGWDEGIALLNKNAKAKLYIPSKLGYGMRGAGGAIPPNSILIFEVELLDF